MKLKKLKQFVDHLNQVFFRCGANTAVIEFTIFEEKDGGNVADVVLGEEVGTFINIVFANEDFTVIFLSQFIDNGSDVFAGSAPWSPEVNHNRFP